MSDIFISYASQDRERILPLVSALEKTGWSVFWDRTIPPGKTWRDWIGREIQNTCCIMVVWSAASVDSRWVHEEAEVGSKKNILIPVLLEDVEPPFGFTSIQTANLVGWGGDDSSLSFKELTEAVSLMLGISPAKQGEQESGMGERVDNHKDEQEQPETSKQKPEFIKDRPDDPAKYPGDEETARSSGAGYNKRIAMIAIVTVVALIGVLVYTKVQFQPVEPLDSPEEEVLLSEIIPPSDEVIQDISMDSVEIPTMLLISGGEFMMGSDPAMDPDSIVNEQPRHRVHIEDFYIGKYEVTFDEYDQFAKANNLELPHDHGFGRGREPVIDVSWEDAVAYAEWLSLVTGKAYRLPTEAEWEYAARAGSETPYWWGHDIRQDNKIWANCEDCGSRWDNKETAPVGQFPANGFGLHDTAGNVWEWVQDCWHNSYKGAPENGSDAWDENLKRPCIMAVRRGGSWREEPRTLRSVFRLWGPGDVRYNMVGFRLARDIEK